MKTGKSISRRDFFKLLGGGVIIGFGLGPQSLFAQRDWRQIYPQDFNAYLRIDENGRVSVYSGKIEMGQGVMTSQAQMAAEELGVGLDQIHMILGDTDLCPWDMGTFGSLTTRMFGPALRQAAAEAKLVLMNMAAARLGAPQSSLVVERGEVFSESDPSKRVSYGELAKGKRVARTVKKQAVLRSVSEFTVMGDSPERLDARDKVTGAAKYAGDIRLPGMLYARILRPPMHGATLSKVDVTAARRLTGVTVVHLSDLIAVLHADPEMAEKGLASIDAEWKRPKATLNEESIFDHLVKVSTSPTDHVQRGDVDEARAKAAGKFDTTYRKGYVAHAPIEPHVAVAEMKDGKMTVWASTQTPFPSRDRVAKALRLHAKRVRIITPYVGGGFGGKSAGGQIIEAARLAAATGKPVQVAWTRAEEFFYDTYDPAAVVKILSGMNTDGRITYWDYAVYGAGGRGTDLFYDVPNARVRVYGGALGSGESRQQSIHPFAVGPWRAPGANMNVFARESQIDAMAAAAKVDPVEFRLRHLTDKRMQSVIKAAADAFGWQPAPAPSGRGVGIACGIDAGTYVASMAKVQVDKTSGDIKVQHIACAQDMGIVVNPEGARMQMEGAITMGLGYTLAEELRFNGGQILDQNFNTYRIPRFSWVPTIQTVLVNDDAISPQGGGEPAITPTGAVIASAVFDATGTHLNRLPMTPARVLAALG